MPEYYFTLEELRELPDMSDEETYTDERCEAAAAYVVDIIEREVGTSFVARTVTNEVHSGGVYSLVLNKPCALSVTSATENGVAVTAGDLSLDKGILEHIVAGTFSPTLWARGRRNIKVTYQAGYSTTPPGDIKEAALQATRARLLTMNSNAGIDDRRTSLNTDMGVVQFVVAGEDRPTGYPEVDAVIVDWRKKLAPLTQGL